MELVSSEGIAVGGNAGHSLEIEKLVAVAHDATATVGPTVILYRFGLWSCPVASRSRSRFSFLKASSVEDALRICASETVAAIIIPQNVAATVSADVFALRQHYVGDIFVSIEDTAGLDNELTRVLDGYLLNTADPNEFMHLLMLLLRRTCARSRRDSAPSSLRYQLRSAQE